MYFGTIKLDSMYRKITIPYVGAAFNEIDHIVTRQDGSERIVVIKGR